MCHKIVGIVILRRELWADGGSLATLRVLSKSKKQGGPGSVRFGYGLGVERFERFRFSVPAVPLRKGGFLCVSVQFHREDSSGSGFGSWKKVPATGGCRCVRRLCRQKKVPAVPVPRSVPAKTVPSGSSERGRCRRGRSEIPHVPSKLQSFALVPGE